MDAENIIESMAINLSVSLEEYLPLKVRIDRNPEFVQNILYCKGTRSVLEICIGASSGLIRRITLLLSEEYEIKDSEFNIDVYEECDLIVNSKNKNCCSYFKTNLHKDGIRIIVSEDAVLKYIKMDRLYIGLSDSDNIAEICLCQLSADEINHIKSELNRN